MELRQLKYFIKAAELQNFTNAADALYITQSTLSQQIRQLEDELRLPLFDRIAKRVRLTEAGNAFLPYAKKTMQDAEDGKVMLRDLMDLKSGILNIGSTYGLTNLLTDAISDFSQQYPQVKLIISFGTTQELLQQLELGKLDLMLSFYSQHNNDHVITEPLFSSKLCLVAHTKHLIASKNSINLKELVSLPLIFPSNGFSIRHQLDEILRKEDLHPHVSIEVNDIHMLLQLVQTGHWVTVLMSSTIVNNPELKAITITGAGMNRQATIGWPKDAYRKKSALALAERLLNYATAYTSF
jgi:LysR family cyn operon transcriptional activator